MLIDKIIREIETHEKKFFPYYDSENKVAEVSFLSSLHKPNKKYNQDYLKKIVFLNPEINKLILIVRKLKKYDYNNLLERSPTSKDYVNMQIDTLAFIHISYGILNVFARLTGYFLKGIKTGSFRSQRKEFIENREKDEAYSIYLVENTEWFDDFHKYRTQITHYHPPFFIPKKNSLELIIKKNRKQSYFIELPDYIYELSSDILHFIEFYAEHFSR